MNETQDNKEVNSRQKEIVLYLIFGVLTTAVSFGIYLLCTRAFSLDATVANIISWIGSVLFAYITNRKYVFKSEKKSFSLIVKEMAGFFSSRLFSGITETAIIFLFVDVFSFYDIAVKLVATIIVVILNYIFSKLFVFKK